MGKFDEVFELPDNKKICDLDILEISDISILKSLTLTLDIRNIYA